MISRLILDRPFIVWCSLLLLTFVSIEMLQGTWLGLDLRLSALAVVAIAFLKVRIIGLEYMELRFAPFALRCAFEVWVIGVWLTISVMYWIGG